MPSTIEELQEQVWDLKERLEDANAQNVLHLKQLQRLRTEIRSKDRELNGLKSSSAAALSLQIEAKNAMIAEFQSRAWVQEKDDLVSQEAKAFHAACLNFISITQIANSNDLTLKKAQRRLNDVGHGCKFSFIRHGLDMCSFLPITFLPPRPLIISQQRLLEATRTSKFTMPATKRKHMPQHQFQLDRSEIMMQPGRLRVTTNASNLRTTLNSETQPTKRPNTGRARTRRGWLRGAKEDFGEL